jgi:hypothetical protein
MSFAGEDLSRLTPGSGYAAGSFLSPRPKRAGVWSYAITGEGRLKNSHGLLQTAAGCCMAFLVTSALILSPLKPAETSASRRWCGVASARFHRAGNSSSFTKPQRSTAPTSALAETRCGRRSSRSPGPDGLLPSTGRGPACRSTTHSPRAPASTAIYAQRTFGLNGLTKRYFASLGVPHSHPPSRQRLDVHALRREIESPRRWRDIIAALGSACASISDESDAGTPGAESRSCRRRSSSDAAKTTADCPGNLGAPTGRPFPRSF